MSVTVLIAHAHGEEDLAEELAGPIRAAGYEVHHGGTVLVGDSLVEEAQQLLNAGAPVVLCGTIKAVGTSWARRVVNAARAASRQNRVFVVQMEEDADTDSISLDGRVAAWWRNQARAGAELVVALARYFPLDQRAADRGVAATAEDRYRALALEACDLVDLANLPETDRHIALRQLELRRLYVALRVRPLPAKSLGDTLEQLEPAGAREPGDGARMPVGRQLGDARRVVVLGDPGSGKSTLLRWIATAYLLRLAEDPDWRALPDVGTLPDVDLLPVLIRCRDLRPESVGGAFDDILDVVLRQQEMAETERVALRGLVRERLTEGTALLLVDGLDEITDPGLRIRLCRQIERVAAAYPRASIVATCRIVGYREMDYRIGRGFAHVLVDALEPADKDDFAARWCALVEPPDRRATATAELIRDVHSTPQIEALTANPMLLTTMALVKRKIGKLPSRRADLYWEAVQVLLNWRREVDLPLDPREAMPQLEYLAHAMCAAGVQRLREDEVLDLLTAMRAEFPQVHSARNHEPKKFLELVEARTGLLVESGEVRHKGRPVPVFEFRHLTFQEYLAARALVEGHHHGHDPTSSLADAVVPLVVSDGPESTGASWHEPVQLCVASCNDADAEEILRELLSHGGDRLVGLTLRCLADEPNVSGRILDQALEAWRESSSYFGDETADLLRSRWRGDAVRFVVERCDGSVRSDSRLVWKLLGPRTQSPRSSGTDAAGLRRRLRSTDLSDALTAAFEIMQRGANDDMQDLAEDFGGLTEDLVALTHERRPLPMTAVWALAWIHRKDGPHRVPTVVARRCADLLRTDPIDPEVARFVLWLARGECGFGDPADLDAVQAAMLDWLSRAEPAMAVYALTESDWRRLPVRTKITEIAARSTDPGVRAAGARIVEVREFDELTDLAAWLGRESDPDVWATAIASLARVEWSAAGFAGHRDVIRPVLADFVPRTEEHGIHADLISAELGDPRAHERLRDRLRNQGIDAAGRRRVLSVIADCRFDKIDRRLVGDQWSQVAHDPAAVIATTDVAEHAKRLELTEDEVRGRYARLAQRWGLRLEWAQEM
ncbi:NACHT domain-containing protein [Asanoa siamensis]|uniref:NACHT domain-containing protein n=1 Tax=Asanoa siamensis TaxID=926357 RepID=A0ABQ4CQX4_9ACTN|nr:NACHT domain-containing protein [Asanoa siamensis]GIF73696.1 hypothetical protein Asi02nite_32140 [Asanoa siamensis]